MLSENRILTQDWGKYNGNHAVFRPARMTAEQLEAGYHHCYDVFYREVDRDKALFDGFRDRVMKASSAPAENQPAGRGARA